MSTLLKSIRRKKAGLNGKARLTLDIVEIIIAAVLIYLVLDFFLFINSTVPSGSMENTIMPGSRVVGWRHAYDFADPERGDVIIFHFPGNEKELLLKRIIGIPGDTVDIKSGGVYLNGSDAALAEPYLMEPMISGQPLHFTVPENAYFCMGDNRNQSFDSRYWEHTYVYRDKIVGKVLFQYFPRIKKIK